MQVGFIESEYLAINQHKGVARLTV
jgi:hypothetical protein